VTTRGRILVTAAVVLAGTTVAPHARADDGIPIGAVVMAMYGLPTVASWIVSLWMLRRRATIARALLGLMTCLGGIWGTVVLILTFEAEDHTRRAAKVICGVVLAGQLLRLGVAVFTRATGDRNKETIKRWWRYL
jgi:hypothetical protein